MKSHFDLDEENIKTKQKITTGRLIQKKIMKLYETKNGILTFLDYPMEKLDRKT